MRSNGLLKWLLLPAAAFVAYIGIRKVDTDRHASPRAAPTTELTAAEMKSLGIAGDTPEDTVATLVGEMQQLRDELGRTVGENKSQQRENERLRLQAANVDKRIQAAIEAERERSRGQHEQVATASQERTNSIIERLEQRLDGLTPPTKSQDLPVGFGLGDESMRQDSGRTFWIEPADATSLQQGSGAPSLTAAFSEAGTNVSNAMEFGPAAMDGAQEAVFKSSSVTPTYTIPADATLSDSVAMTALIGRIPVDGAVTDAFPFKAIIGSRNLTANGIELPALRGAVVSGMASGDWTLSCVRGRIHSITFVFEDGRIVSYPKNKRPVNESSEQSTQSGIGFVSDRHGIPCVTGERVSNAAQYLGTQSLVTAASAGVAAVLNSEEGNASYLSSNGNTLGSIGISGNDALSRVLGRGVDDISDWVRRLYGEAFPAIYVKPGAEISLHIEETIHVDYDRSGRKVRFDSESFEDGSLE